MGLIYGLLPSPPQPCSDGLASRTIQAVVPKQIHFHCKVGISKTHSVILIEACGVWSDVR